MNVLLTGASGNVGQALRPLLAASYGSVLLNSLDPITNPAANEKQLPGDLSDANLVDQLVGQVNAIVHLGALVGPDYTFEQVMNPNVVASYHLFEAARRHHVQRIVYASSHHVVGFLPRDVVVDERTPLRADSWYGVSKAFGEIMASFVVDAYGLDVFCIRIGYVGDNVPDERRMHTWTSARDLAALIDIGLRGSQRGFHVVYGVSNCPDPLFDNSHAQALGYRPQDSSVNVLTNPTIAKQKPDPTKPEQRYIGGHFSSRNQHLPETK